MVETVVQVNFRMPAELKQRLEDSARRAGRSLTQEVVRRLEYSYLHPETEFMRKLEEENDGPAVAALSTVEKRLDAIQGDLRELLKGVKGKDMDRRFPAAQKPKDLLKPVAPKKGGR